MKYKPHKAHPLAIANNVSIDYICRDCREFIYLRSKTISPDRITAFWTHTNKRRK